MQTSTTAPLVSLLLAAMSATTYAAEEGVWIIEDDIIFTVDRFDDGGRKPHTIKFDDDGDSSKYRFNTDEFTTNTKGWDKKVQSGVDNQRWPKQGTSHVLRGEYATNRRPRRGGEG